MDQMGNVVAKPATSTQVASSDAVAPADALVAHPSTDTDAVTTASTEAPVPVEIPVQEDRATRWRDTPVMPMLRPAYESTGPFAARPSVVPQGLPEFTGPLAETPIVPQRGFPGEAPVVVDGPMSAFPARPAGPQLPLPPRRPLVSDAPQNPLVGSGSGPLAATLQSLLGNGAPQSQPLPPPAPAQAQPEAPLPIADLLPPPGTEGRVPQPGMPIAERFGDPPAAELPMPIDERFAPARPPVAVSAPLSQPPAAVPGPLEAPVSLEDPKRLDFTSAAPPNVVPLAQQNQFQAPADEAPRIAPAPPPDPTLPETAPVPTANPAAQVAAAAPADKPAAAAAAGQQVAAATTGSNGGQGDTPAAVASPHGQLPRQMVEAMVRDIMIGDESPEVKMQALQRLYGTLGLTYNPAVGVGPGHDPSKTAAAVTFAGGGTAAPRSSMYGTDEEIRVEQAKAAAAGEQARLSEKEKLQTPKEFGGGLVTFQKNADGSYTAIPVVGAEPGEQNEFGGPGEKETKAQTILMKRQAKMRNGEELTPQDIDYIRGANAVLRPVKEIKGKDSKGRDTSYFQQEPPIAGMLTVEEALDYNKKRAAGGQKGAPAAAAAAPAAAEGGGAAAAPAAAAAEPTATNTSGGSTPANVGQPGRVGELIKKPDGGYEIRTSDSVDVTEGSAKTYSRLMQARNAIKYFRNLKSSDTPEPIKVALNNPNNPALMQQILNSNDPKDQTAREWLMNAAALQDALVHETTGAASTTIENMNMTAQSVPRAGDSDRMIQQKNSNTQNIIRGMRATLNQRFDPDALELLDQAYRDDGLDLKTGETTPGKPASPAEAAAAQSDKDIMDMPPPPVPEGADPKLWPDTWRHMKLEDRKLYL